MSSLAEDYAPGEDLPLGSYAVLVALYLASVAGVGVAVGRRGRPLPRVTMAALTVSYFLQLAYSRAENGAGQDLPGA